MNEGIEGEALTLTYDSKSDTLRLTDQAKVRRLRGTELADQAIGAVIVYDNGAEVFTVSGGAKTPENPAGRVIVELAPRSGTPAAAEAASQAASAPGSTR